jgi:hypothetical protein
MSGIGTAVVASAVIGGVVASDSSRRAGNAQKDAAALASQTELEQHRQNREDMQPWREAGMGALGQMTAGTAAGGDFNRDFTLADFTKDPGYDFRMQQGQRALDSSAAARGGALSGAAIKGSLRYGQDFGSGEYQNAYNRFNNDRTQRFNRLASLAGVGQTATRDVAQQGAQVASNVGNNMTGAGNAQASSYVGQGNAISGAANTLGNFAMNRYYMSQLPGGASTMPTTPSSGGWTGGWGDTGGATTFYG